ncbi:MAG: N-acetyltransferase family protein, partial [Phycisphaerae bacterium]
VAAAVTLEGAGRVAGLLSCSPDSGQVDPDALAETIRRAADAALAADNALVNILIESGDDRRGRLLQQAGFRHLATLEFMERSLPALPEEVPPREGVRLRACELYSDDALAELVAATYVDTLDCPGLSELRDVRDALAGHRDTGIYTPEHWRVAEQDGRLAGFAAVNETIDGEAEVVYLGVVPAFRGAGLGTWLTRKLCQQATEAGLSGIRLAVDSRNEPARRAYRQAGFRFSKSREAYIKH